MEVDRSARKHGVDDEDIQRAGGHFVVAYAIDDDKPPRELRLVSTPPGGCWKSSCSRWTTGASWRSMR